MLSRLDGQFILFGVAVAATPETGAQGHADAQRLMAALAPWANGRTYLNFAEEPVDTRTAYADASWIQLTGIRSAMDPDGLFVGNHPVPRLFEDGRRSYSTPSPRGPAAARHTADRAAAGPRGASGYEAE